DGRRYQGGGVVCPHEYMEAILSGRAPEPGIAEITIKTSWWRRLLGRQIVVRHVSDRLFKEQGGDDGRT
ncbi:MAG TPA: hypothetical protein VMW24_24595, partial [Sedimentisphaerales bacterium]|nr:hypothetical protein [Sedimentisphaerales bacterium]